MRDNKNEEWPPGVPTWSFQGIGPPLQRTLWRTFTQQAWLLFALVGTSGAAAAFTLFVLVHRLGTLSDFSSISQFLVMILLFVYLPVHGALHVLQSLLGEAEDRVELSLKSLGLWPTRRCLQSY